MDENEAPKTIDDIPEPIRSIVKANAMVFYDGDIDAAFQGYLRAREEAIAMDKANKKTFKHSSAHLNLRATSGKTNQ